MPKSGRERKEKRSERKSLERQLPTHWRPDNEQQAQQNNLLVKEVIQRWRTTTTGNDVKGIHTRDMTARELAILVTRRNMLSPDPKVANTAVANLISMEKQNQLDTLPKEPTQHIHLHGEVETPLSSLPDSEILEAKAVMFNSNGKKK